MLVRYKGLENEVAPLPLRVKMRGTEVLQKIGEMCCVVIWCNVF